MGKSSLKIISGYFIAFLNDAEGDFCSLIVRHQAHRLLIKGSKFILFTLNLSYFHSDRLIVTPFDEYCPCINRILIDFYVLSPPNSTKPFSLLSSLTLNLSINVLLSLSIITLRSLPFFISQKFRPKKSVHCRTQALAKFLLQPLFLCYSTMLTMCKIYRKLSSDYFKSLFSNNDIFFSTTILISTEINKNRQNLHIKLLLDNLL